MKQTVECERCNGKGTIKAFCHIAAGVCFKCGGAGKIEVTVKSEKQIAREEAKKSYKKAQYEAIYNENMRKQAEAMKIYKGDKRIRVQENHPYYYMHVIEVAKLDMVWETL